MSETLSERQFDKGIWNPQTVATAVNEIVAHNKVKGIAVAIIRDDEVGNTDFLTYDDSAIELVGLVDVLKDNIKDNME